VFNCDDNVIGQPRAIINNQTIEAGSHHI
jgi:hypothetical protein